MLMFLLLDGVLAVSWKTVLYLQALGTAEMIVDMVLDKPLKVDSAPFDAIGRCC